MKAPYACPGCGVALTLAPGDGHEEWLKPQYWCIRCGGCGAVEVGTRVPRWYALVVAEFDLISPMMGLVLDPETVEPLYEQARHGAEAGAEVIDVGEDAIAREAARRTAAAIALLAYGGGWDAYGKDDRLTDALKEGRLA